MTARKIFSQTQPDGTEVHLYGKDDGDNEIHIDGAWGLTYINGACKINLFSTAPTEPKNSIERREVAVRIVMAVPTVFALKDYLVDQCKHLQEKGVVRTEDQSQQTPVESTTAKN